MFITVKSFLESWKTESDSTLKVFQNLTDQSLKQKVTKQGRSLGFIAWHITITISEMLSKTGLPFESLENKPAPDSAKEILHEYEKEAKAVNDLISKLWTDEMLNEEVNMYGQVWKREQVLASLIAHQIHHRGQMTVLMRQAGLQVPGVYGPSKEEWSLMGMPEQE
jgi:uncharacterized damage-inducible protein DinB